MTTAVFLFLVSYNHFDKIFRLVDILANFPLTRSKMKMVISNKHGMYELLNQLKFRILRKIRKILKLARIINLVPHLPAKIKIFSILAKNFSKIEIELFP